MKKVKVKIMEPHHWVSKIKERIVSSLKIIHVFFFQNSCLNDEISKKILFPFLEKLLKRARGREQQPLLSKIRREGAFKPNDTIKTQDEKKPKYSLICIGSTRDAKNRIILSEKAQSEQSWAMTALNNAPIEVQKKLSKLLPKNKNTKECSP